MDIVSIIMKNHTTSMDIISILMVRISIIMEKDHNYGNESILMDIVSIIMENHTTSMDIISISMFRISIIMEIKTLIMEMNP